MTFLQNSTLTFVTLKNFHWRKTEQYKKKTLEHPINIESHNSAYFNVICFNTNPKNNRTIAVIWHRKYMQIAKILTFTISIWIINRVTAISCFVCKLLKPVRQFKTQSKVILGLIFIHIHEFTSIRNYDSSLGRPTWYLHSSLLFLVKD